MSVNSKTVAITGLNGFIALHIARLFLSSGWTVRGSVRTEEKAKNVLQNPAIAEWVDKGRCTVNVVPDYGDSRLEELVRDVDAVCHCGTPIGYEYTSWIECKENNIQGLKNFMKVCSSQQSIKSIAIMSSGAAVWTQNPRVPEGPEIWWQKQKGAVYNEDSMNEIEDQDCLDADPSNPMAFFTRYAMMKKTIEQMSVEISKESSSKFALSLICPTLVYGPPIQFSTSEQLLAAPPSLSTGAYLGLLAGKEAPIPQTWLDAWVDARDVATAFYRVIDKNLSGRYIVSAGDEPDMAFWAERTRQLLPQLADLIPIEPEGFVRATAPENKGLRVDNSRTNSILGLKYLSVDETLKDGFEYLEKIGVVEAMRKKQQTASST